MFLKINDSVMFATILIKIISEEQVKNKEGTLRRSNTIINPILGKDTGFFIHIFGPLIG